MKGVTLDPQAPSIEERRRWIRLCVLTLVLGSAVCLGRDFAQHLPSLEEWIAAHGWIGWLVFVGAVTMFTSIFIPDTVFAVAAGVLFGVLGGTLLMIIAALCAATVNFALSRSLLHNVVDRALYSRPRLAAMQRAVNGKGLRFQLLLRLTPINPTTVSYVLGASGTPFPAFLLGCVGLIPALAVEVYFGHAARHAAAVVGGVSRHPPMLAVLTMAGLAVCVVLLLYITRVAKRALASYEMVSAITNNGVDTRPKTPE